MHEFDQSGDGERQLAGSFLAGENDAEDAKQGERAAGQRVDEELAGGVLALRPAPDTDQEEQGHQGQLEEGVEQDNVEGEEDTGTPRRDITLGGPRDRLQAMAAFFERQVGSFAVQSVDLTAKGLNVRFPVRTRDIGLGTGPAPLQGGPAALRVADLRRDRTAEQLNLVRIDGTAAGSLEASDDANPFGYRSMPAGTYVVMTNRAGGGPPVIRQVLTLHPGVTYTLALFSAA